MTVTIFESHSYRVESHGNGGAYTITRLRDSWTCFIQYGDDATVFRGNLDACYKSTMADHLLDMYDFDAPALGVSR